MFVADDWKDYELIDAGGGERLERWNRYILRRPDPQAIWPPFLDEDEWKNRSDAWYHRSSSGGGQWEFLNAVPGRWKINYNKLSFFVEPTGFKHTGVFPEQAVNWDWIIGKIQNTESTEDTENAEETKNTAEVTNTGTAINVLNLFAYTGGATLASAYAGAAVCHVDAAKGMIARAKENLTASGLESSPARFITDDAVKFVNREIRRRRKYDAVIMDPPSYGRGPDGEFWKLEDSIFGLVKSCMELLSEKPIFFLINSYTTGLSPQVIKNILEIAIGKLYTGRLTADEIGLPVTSSGLILPCGAFCRWEAL